MSWNVTSDTEDFVTGNEINFGWKISDEKDYGWGDCPKAKFRTKEYDLNIPYLEIEIVP